ncbi:hypothetical protein PAECIP111893_02860 [Paenibacillus plantiphilus]|uniref:Peptidase M56 domain-containing protein n=1 Tax=Paenibacillus plantiphilus TaxID=2905650 RepID=A0ABN8GIL1_9BACL|nr:M56 family metallopeptidase [Paenibacillus plantiphilus]CAH1208218.1 hypothetical protein PAECIP111893_02860 [Paenibacillus plantiphilus]
MLSLLTQFFQWILTTSLMACVLIVFILAAKLLLGERLKPRWSYMLWMLLVLRLLLPWTPDSSFSVFNVVSLDIRMEANEAGPAASSPEQTPAEKGAVEQTSAEQTTAGQTLVEQTTAGQTLVEQTTAGQTLVEQTTAGQTNAVRQQGFAAHEQESAAPASVPQLIASSDAEESAHIATERSTLSFVQLMSMIWLIGALAAAGLLIRVNVPFIRRIKLEPHVARTDSLAILEQCKQELGIRRKLALIESRHVVSPTLMGVFRPKLLMPTGVMELLSERELRHIYLHELCHLKRNDLAVNAIMNALLILHWFNPLLWFSYNKLREDQELACDSMALAHMGAHESTDYARTIIKLLELFSAPTRRLASTVTISGNKQELKRRIRMIQSQKPNAYRWSLLGISLMLLLSGCALTNASDSSSGNTQGSAVYGDHIMQLGGSEKERQPTQDAALGELLVENDGVALYGTRTQDDIIEDYGTTPDAIIENITVRTSTGSKTFAWKSRTKLTTSKVHPYVNVGDVDADGRDEIVIFLIASDSEQRPDNIYKQEIHVLNMEDLSELPVEDPMKAIQERVTSSITDNGDTVKIIVDTGDERREENYAKFLLNDWANEVDFQKDFYYLFAEDGIKTVVSSSPTPPGSGITWGNIKLLVEYDSSLKVKNIKIAYMS